MSQQYKFTVNLNRKLTDKEFYALEQALAAQCEAVDIGTKDFEESMVGYEIGSERLEEA